MSSNWTRHWQRLAASTDYDRAGGVLSKSEDRAELCRPPPGKELQRRNVRAGRNGRQLKKRNSGARSPQDTGPTRLQSSISAEAMSCVDVIDSPPKNATSGTISVWMKIRPGRPAGTSRPRNWFLSSGRKAPHLLDHLIWFAGA